MAKIKHYRTSVSGNMPDPAILEIGEIAINTTDEKLFFKNSSNEIVQVFTTITPYTTHASGNKTMVKNEYCMCSLTGNSTLTLPSSPIIGDTIYILDAGANFDTINIELSSTDTIMGSTSNVQLDIKNKEYKIIYTGTDWRII